MVLDASALVELVIEGHHRLGAEALLTRYERSPKLTLVSAAHGLIEAIGALRRLVARKDLTGKDGAAAVGWLCALELVLDATAPRARRIWELRESMRAYDAAYAATAEAFGVPLVTTDRRLERACQSAGIAASGLDGPSTPGV